MKSLIIVESFTKTKTIKKYLGDMDVAVAFSGGHIYNLPKDTLGFDTDTWEVQYVPTNLSIIKIFPHSQTLSIYRIGLMKSMSKRIYSNAQSIR